MDIVIMMAADNSHDRWSITFCQNSIMRFPRLCCLLHLSMKSGVCLASSFLIRLCLCVSRRCSPLPLLVENCVASEKKKRSVGSVSSDTCLGV